MARIIHKVAVPVVKKAKKKRVAAYARVSASMLHHSFCAQVEYYEKLIQSNPEWEYVDVFKDEAISGTQIKNRFGFQKMLEECKAGNIDMILTKSISRFARNTVDLLDTIRELKRLGVDVYFERERIHTITGAGELLLTILASFAQEESASISKNVRWGIQKKFKLGIPYQTTDVLGYYWVGKELKIERHQAAIVRRIFREYMAGESLYGLAERLNQDAVVGVKGGMFSANSVKHILQNEIYTGDLMLQKTFRVSHITKKERRNRGELPRYLIHEHHKAIIRHDVFEAVQKRIAERAALSPQTLHRKANGFTQKIVCGKCGAFYRKAKNSWICKGKTDLHSCNGLNLPDYELRKITCEVLGIDEIDDVLVAERITKIVCDEWILTFNLADGSSVSRAWEKRKPYKRSLTHVQNIRQALKALPAERLWNANCFTKKIYCGICGGVLWRGTDSKERGCKHFFKHADNKCKHLKRIQEAELISVFCKAFGGVEFNKDDFQARVSKVEVFPERVKIYLNDGTVKSCNRVMRKRNCFTKKIKCEQCGAFLYRDSRKRVSDVVYRFRHSNKEKCNVKPYSQEEMYGVLSAAMNIDDFQEDVFEEKVETILVSNAVTKVLLKDGTIFIKERAV